MRRSLIATMGITLAMATVAPALAQAPQFFPPTSPGNASNRGGGSGFGGGGSGGGPAFIPPQSNPGGGGPGRFGGGPGGPGPNRFGGAPGGPGPNRFGGGPGYRGGYDGYRHHHHDGAAIGAGVAGLAAGALIGGAIANQNYANGPYDNGYGYGYGYDQPVYPPQDEVADEGTPVPAGDDVAYCQRRYRSYDVASGTYLGYDGARHPCP